MQILRIFKLLKLSLFLKLVEKKEVKSGTAVVARVESCALMFYVATERQGLEIWKSRSQTHTRLSWDTCFQFGEKGFLCFAYYYLTPLVGNMMYI